MTGDKMGRSTYSGPLKSKNGFELGADEDVSLGSVLIASGSNSLNITTAQVVETSASTPDKRLKISINGVEFYLVLEAV